MATTRTKTQTAKLAEWFRAALETRGDGPPIASSQLYLGSGGGESTGSARFAVKSPTYYSVEKCEDLAAEWIDAAQEAADAMGEDLTVFVGLSVQGSAVMAERSLPWRVSSSMPSAIAYSPNEKGTIGLLQKLVSDMGRQITHAMPALAQQALAHSDLNHQRLLAYQQREEQVRQQHEIALSTTHERDLERMQEASRIELRREFMSSLKPLIPALRTAVAKALGANAPPPKQIAAPGSAPPAAETAAPAPTGLRDFWGTLSEEQQETLAGNLAETLNMDQLINLKETLEL